MGFKVKTGKTHYVKRTMRDRQLIWQGVFQTDHFWNWKWTRTQQISLRYSSSTGTDFSSWATLPPSTSLTLPVEKHPADFTKPKGSSLSTPVNIFTKVMIAMSKCKFSLQKPQLPLKLLASPNDPIWHLFLGSNPSKSKLITSLLSSI